VLSDLHDCRGIPGESPLGGDLQILVYRARPPEDGFSSEAGVVGTGTDPAGSADIDSGPLTASTIDLTISCEESGTETG